MSTGKALAVLLIAGAIAFAAWEAGRRSGSTTPAQSPEKERGAVPTSTLEVPTPEPPSVERSSSIEVPLGGELPREAAPDPSEAEKVAAEPPPRPTPAPLPEIEERRDDDPARCLTFEAIPNSISAYGASGRVVQLIVRARNACATTFSGPHTYFRVVAAGADGFAFGSANGRFHGPIGAFGTAETLVAIEGDPTRVVSYRVELQ